MISEDFTQSVLQVLMRCMEEETKSPWRYRLLAGWASGGDIYVVFETSVNDLILGDTFNVRDCLDAYGDSTSHNLAHVIFQADVQANPYYEVSFENSGLNSHDQIYWFGNTQITKCTRSVNDIDEKDRR